ncbi:MAG TPA: TlpA disulfide reductase family protein [Cytophagaceae bacterium]|nr:TlpA disulfide reductase family protein [Cytophagaceae bacterium]
MRYIYILLFVLVSLASKATIIEGHTYASLYSKTLLLTMIDYDTRKDSLIEKIQIDSKGFFSTSLQLREPAIYSLGMANEAPLLLMVLKPEDKIKLTIDSLNVVCDGSIETEYLTQYEKERKSIYKKRVAPVADSLDKAYNLKKEKEIEYYTEQYDLAINEYKKELGAWAVQPFFIQSLAAIHHSLRWNPDRDIPLMDTMLFYFQKKYPTYKLTKQLENKIKRVKRIALGATAPSFKSKQADGTDFEFSTSTGNYILLDFWASWCGPCRKESPEFVRIYNLYKDKGFTIVSVSLDEKEVQWVKAIKKDNYTWINVSDLKGWKSETAVLYSVSSIPSNFLIDKNGKIVAKNLLGKNLEMKLAELCK